MLALSASAGVAILAGCQSGAERDIVQREMRQQEDQIYELQDNMADYQQLVCQYRSENAALKQQLMEQGSSDGAMPARMSPRRNRTMQPSPPTETPIPPSQRRGASPPVDDSLTPPEVPSLDLNPPSTPPVPSLNSSSMIEDRAAPSDDISASDFGEGRRREAASPENVATDQENAQGQFTVVQAEHVEEIEAPAVVEGLAIPATQPAVAVAIRGDVRLDAGSDGPRLLIEVEPLTASGERAAFQGRMSLMVMDPNHRSAQGDLARWDFEPEDLTPTAVRDDMEGVCWHIPLQLPAGLPKDRPVELWVRLLPDDGSKLLGHTTVDLSRVSRFASIPGPGKKVVRAAEHAIVVEQAVAVEPEKPSRVNQAVRQSEWTTARPDEISIAAKPRQNSTGWRTATQPMPEIAPRPAKTLNTEPALADPLWSPTR